jgi:hypothetical protein
MKNKVLGMMAALIVTAAPMANALTWQVTAAGASGNLTGTITSSSTTCGPGVIFTADLSYTKGSTSQAFSGANTGIVCIDALQSRAVQWGSGSPELLTVRFTELLDLSAPADFYNLTFQVFGTDLSIDRGEGSMSTGTSVPEPGSLALLGLGLLGLAVSRRKA